MTNPFKQIAKTGSKKSKKDITLTKINEFIKAFHNKKLPYVQKPGHKPSSFGSKCFRKIYYNYFRVESDKPTDAALGKIFDTGNAYEGMVMNWLRGIGEHIPYRNKSDGEIPKAKDGSGTPNPQFPISIVDWRIPRGYIDNVGISDGELWLYEIKSKASYKFSGLEAPDPEHIIQVTPYFKAFNETLLEGGYSHIPELQDQMEAVGVKILYINKDTSAIKLFTLRTDELFSEMDKFNKKVIKANNYADAKELPPKTPEYCNYCPFQSKCEKNWNEV